MGIAPDLNPYFTRCCKPFDPARRALEIIERSLYVHDEVIPLNDAHDPRAIANLLLKEVRSRGYEISNLKLQKLLFLCHAFYLVETGRPLIRGSFEAWQYGPVHREAYDAFKGYGARPITEDALRFDPITGARKSIAIPTDRRVSDVIQNVARFYGPKSALA